jgi:hypothetical protein
MYISYSRQVKRLESVSRSPIYALFSESLNGISTIRAFNDEARYVRCMQHFLDENTRIHLNDMLGNRFAFINTDHFFYEKKKVTTSSPLVSTVFAQDIAAKQLFTSSSRISTQSEIRS